MPGSTQELIQDLLALPATDRARIADELLASLDLPDAEVDAHWIAEAERRLQAYDSGEVKALDEEEFFADEKP